MAKYRAFGTQLQYGDGGSPEVFTSITALQDIEIPAGTADKIDVTTQDSTGGFKEYLQGLKDAGSFKVTCVYDPADLTHLAMNALYASGDWTNWKAILPTSPTHDITFTGYVAGADLKAPVDKEISMEYEIMVTGQVVL